VMALPETRLFEVMQKLRSKGGNRRRSTAPIRSEGAAAAAELPVNRSESNVLPEEKTLLRLMLKRGEPLIEFILGRMALNEFTDGPSREIASALMQMYEAEHVDRDAIVDGSFGSEAQRLAADVLVDSVEISENWQKRQNINVPQLNEDAFESASSAMVLLKLDRIDDVIEAQRRRIYDVSHEDEDVRSLQEELMHLMQLRRSIERREFLTGAGEGHEA
ncbi:MAG: hypothetical protein KJO98_13570, partial [Rhodothermia bacterium]|nr:hypothetical protein [Rhodothermia bacterium]